VLIHTQPLFPRAFPFSFHTHVYSRFSCPTPRTQWPRHSSPQNSIAKNQITYLTSVPHRRARARARRRRRRRLGSSAAPRRATREGGGAAGHATRERQGARAVDDDVGRVLAAARRHEQRAVAVPERDHSLCNGHDGNVIWGIIIILLIVAGSELNCL